MGGVPIHKLAEVLMHDNKIPRDRVGDVLSELSRADFNRNRLISYEEFLHLIR